MVGAWLALRTAPFSSLFALCLPKRMLLHLLLSLLLLLSPLQSVISQSVRRDDPGFETGIITSLDLPLAGAAGPTYYLQVQGADSGGTDGGMVFRLVFSAAVPQHAVPIGVLVNVSYEKIVDGVMHSCSTPTEPQQQQGQGSGLRRRVLLGEKMTTSRAPRIIVFITTFCGYPEPAHISPQNVTDLIFTGKGMEGNRTLAGYYDTCSYGQVKLTAPNVKILGPVEVPCRGGVSSFVFSTGQDFTSTACDEKDNLPKWQFWLGEWAKRVHNVNAEDYHHRVIILPKFFVSRIKGCGGFAGLATSGRWGTYTSAVNDWGFSFVWWAGEDFGDIEILLHEIGHTYGMAHAALPQLCDLWDQCDNTCTMGAYGGQGIRCFNAPHNWQIGWGRPFLQLNDAALQPGNSTQVQIPSQLLTPNHSVMLIGAGLDPGQRLFIAARLNTYPYDLPYGPWDNGKAFLIIHTYNGTDAVASMTTVLVGQIQIGQLWRDPNSNLVVRFDSWSAPTGTAVARICRRRADKEVTCGDGLDDDCDFLQDAADPDCVQQPMDGGASDGTRASPVPAAVLPNPVRQSTPSSPRPAAAKPTASPRKPPRQALSPWPQPPPSPPSPSFPPSPRHPPSPRPPRPPPRPATPLRPPHASKLQRNQPPPPLPPADGSH